MNRGPSSNAVRRARKELIAFAKACTLPPGSLLLGILLGLFSVGAGYPRQGLWVAGLSLGLLWALGTPAVARRLLRPIRRHAPLLGPGPTDGSTVSPEGVQAVVVLDAGGRDGAQEHPGLGVSALTLERLRYGAWLHRQLDVPVLVTGDGAGRVQSEVLENSFGVLARWVEERSRNTEENARFSAAILLPEGVLRIALVTHYWHMPRAEGAFRRAGFEVVPAPMGFGGYPRGLRDYLPSVVAWQDSYLAFHELIGGAWYRLRFRPHPRHRTIHDEEESRP